MAKRWNETVRRRHKGQATLEFALVIAFLLLIMFGIIDFSRVFFAYATMSHGVREAARYGIVQRNRDDVEAMKQAIARRAEGSIFLVGGEATIEVQLPGDDYGDNPECTEAHVCRLVVIASGDLNVWTPIVPDLQIEAQSTMHFE